VTVACGNKNNVAINYKSNFWAWERPNKKLNPPKNHQASNIWSVVSTPSEKYESQLGVLFPIYGKKHVPNHQPDMYGNKILTN